MLQRQVPFSCEASYQRPKHPQHYVRKLHVSAALRMVSHLFVYVASCICPQVVYDRDTGRSRGFGFVTMNSPEDAQAAIERFDGSVSAARGLSLGPFSILALAPSIMELMSLLLFILFGSLAVVMDGTLFKPCHAV